MGMLKKLLLGFILSVLLVTFFSVSVSATPTFSSTTLTPLFPTTSDDLVLQCTLDGYGTTSSYEYKFVVDGVLNESGAVFNNELYNSSGLDVTNISFWIDTKRIDDNTSMSISCVEPIGGSCEVNAISYNNTYGDLTQLPGSMNISAVASTFQGDLIPGESAGFVVYDTGDFYGYIEGFTWNSSYYTTTTTDWVSLHGASALYPGIKIINSTLGFVAYTEIASETARATLFNWNTTYAPSISSFTSINYYSNNGNNVGFHQIDKISDTSVIVGFADYDTTDCYAATISWNSAYTLTVQDELLLGTDCWTIDISVINSTSAIVAWSNDTDEGIISLLNWNTTYGDLQKGDTLTIGSNVSKTIPLGITATKTSALLTYTPLGEITVVSSLYTFNGTLTEVDSLIYGTGSSLNSSNIAYISNTSALAIYEEDSGDMIKVIQWGVAPGVKNPYNISSSFTSSTEEWYGACRASYDDTTYSPWYFSTKVDINAPPVVNTSTILPLSPLSNTSLQGWCNVTDADSDTITYEWKWYEDNVENNPGKTANYSMTLLNTLEHTATGAGEYNDVSVIDSTHGIYVSSDTTGDDGYVTVVVWDENYTQSIVGSRYKFESDEAYNLEVEYLASNYSVVVYETGEVTPDGWLKILSWNSTFGGLVTVATLEFDAAVGQEPSITVIDDEKFLIVYGGSFDDGWAQIIEWDAVAGTLTVLSTLEFDVENGLEPDVVLIDSRHAVVAYEGPSTDGYFNIIEWDDSFTLTEPSVPGLSRYEYRNVDVDDSNIMLIDSTHALISAEMITGSGNAAVFIVSWNSTYGALNLESTASLAQGNMLSARLIDTNHAIIALEGGGDAWVSMINWSDDFGAITELYTQEYDEDQGTYSNIDRIDETHYITTYKGIGSEGFTSIFDINKLYYTQAVNKNLNNVSSASMDVADSWIFSCRGFDGLQYSSWLNSSAMVIQNNLVTNTSTILPTNPSTDQDLQGWCNVTNEFGANVSYWYKWYVNNVLNETGNTSFVLPNINTNINNLSSSSTTAGENWTFSCRGYDGTHYSDWLNSTAVTIISLSLDTVTITPTTFQDTDTDLTCNYTYTIGGGDTFDTALFKWYNDTADIGITTETLASTNFVNGENITCSAWINTTGGQTAGYTNSSVEYIGLECGDTVTKTNYLLTMDRDLDCNATTGTTSSENIYFYNDNNLTFDGGGYKLLNTVIGYFNLTNVTFQNLIMESSQALASISSEPDANNDIQDFSLLNNLFNFTNMASWGVTITPNSPSGTNSNINITNNTFISGYGLLSFYVADTTLTDTTIYSNTFRQLNTSTYSMHYFECDNNNVVVDFYDNYYYNYTDFASFSETSCTFTVNLNTTKTTRTNIIGGPNTGGNHWADYTGYTDADGDGIADASYSPAGTTLVDYLPLINYTPIMNTSIILPANPYVEEDLRDYCNATHTDGDDVTYEWKMYKEGDLFTEGATINSTSTSWCYQETANVSTACGGLATGAYGFNSSGWFNVNNTYDGGWSTGGTALDSEYWYVNYTKPTYANSGSLWQAAADQPTPHNKSIPGACWIQSPLQFRIQSNSAGEFSTAKGYCYNGAGWTELFDYGYISGTLYEEAMWWNMSVAQYYTEGVEVNVYNLSSSYTSTGDNWTLSCRAYDGIGYSGWLNSSIVLVSDLSLSTLILPSTYQDTDTDLTCNYTLGIGGGDSVNTTEFKWYNDTATLPATTIGLASGNFTNGENITCSVQINTTLLKSTGWTNSSTEFIGAECGDYINKSVSLPFNMVGTGTGNDCLTIINSDIDLDINDKWFTGNMDDAIVINTSLNNITIRDGSFRFTSTAGVGEVGVLGRTGVSNITVQNIYYEMTATSNTGVHFSTAGTFSDLIIQHNRFNMTLCDDITESAIFIGNTADTVTIYNNTIYGVNNSCTGIDISLSGNSFDINSNTFTNLGRSLDDVYGTIRNNTHIGNVFASVGGSSSFIDNNITIQNNTDVFELQSSGINTIYNNYFIGPFTLFDATSGSDASNTTIYNNDVGAMSSFLTGAGTPTIYLNTSESVATNIVTGENKGGNYWMNNTACEDLTGDDICDSSYTPQATFIDYLSLTNNFTPTYTVALQPLPAQVGIDSNCTYTMLTNRTQDQIAYRWVKNTINLNISNRTLGYGNFSGGDNITCGVQINTTHSLPNTGAWTDSSTALLGDNQSPEYVTSWLAGSSITVNTAGTIYANFTDNSGSLDYATMQIHGVSGNAIGLSDWNRSMILSSGDTWARIETFTVTGTYNFSYFFADGNGNTNSAPGVGVLLTVKEASSSQGGGGGSKVVTLPPSLNLTGYCGDNICQEGETPTSCWTDCKINLDTVVTCLFDDDIECNWNQSWFPAALLIFLLMVAGISIYMTEVRKKKK